MTIDFVPLSNYGTIFQILVLAISFAVALHALGLRTQPELTIFSTHTLGAIIVLMSCLYMGLRPVNGVFVDMMAYARSFESTKLGIDSFFPDFGFNLFQTFSASILSLNAYFLLCSILYIGPLYLACRRWFGTDALIGLLMFLGAFSFWAYGVNGIRNGIASSLFVLAMSYRKLLPQIFLLLSSVAFHGSMIVPTIAFCVVVAVRRTGVTLSIWVLAIPTSLAGGNFFNGLLSPLAAADQRISYLSGILNPAEFRYSGFRWDFLAYSAVGILAGVYYIYHCKYSDETYRRLFGTYVLTNASWILIIQSNFTNRFAYLSWFLQPVILIYPLLRSELLSQQRVKVGIMLILNAGFSVAFLYALAIGY